MIAYFLNSQEHHRQSLKSQCVAADFHWEAHSRQREQVSSSRTSQTENVGRVREEACRERRSPGRGGESRHDRVPNRLLRQNHERQEGRHKHGLLTVLRLEVQDQRHRQTPCLVRAHFLVHRQPSSYRVHPWRNGLGALWGLYKATDPTHQGPALMI